MLVLFLKESITHILKKDYQFSIEENRRRCIDNTNSLHLLDACLMLVTGYFSDKISFIVGK